MNAPLDKLHETQREEPVMRTALDYVEEGQLHAIEKCLEELMFGMENNNRSQIQNACRGIAHFSSKGFNIQNFPQGMTSEKVFKFLLNVIIGTSDIDGQGNNPLILNDTVLDVVGAFSGDRSKIQNVTNTIARARGDLPALIPHALAQLIYRYALKWGPTSGGYDAGLENELDKALMDILRDNNLDGDVRDLLETFDKMQWNYGHID